ncbi:MAG: hypothetical protein ABIF01_05265 [Candidatus Micrarchaeota archaeon]
MVEFDEKTQGLYAIIAAIVVLFAAAMDQLMVSLVIAVLALASLAAYMFLHANETDKKKGKK